MVNIYIHDLLLKYNSKANMANFIKVSDVSLITCKLLLKVTEMENL